MRALLAGLLCLAAAALPLSAVAQDVPVRVEIRTSEGVIVAETDPRAPVTSANFLRYVDAGRLDGMTFYRGLELAPGHGLIQGGTRNLSDRTFPPIAHEPTSETGLTHTDGALSMARFAPGTATGDFFIILGDVTSLDAGRVRADDPGFAVFGRVVEGLDVARRILAAPKSATEGEGDMRGQMLEPRVQILSASRVISSSSPE